MKWLSIFVAGNNSLLDWLLYDSMKRHIRKPEKPLSQWFEATEDTWYLTSTPRQRRRFYVAWFFTHMFCDFWYLFEEAIKREDKN